MTKSTSSNRNFHKAKAAKKDEFYTQLADIENEVRNYFDHFKGKTVYCNCDDPRISNFFRYFSYNFKFLGLKKLIATCYRNTDPEMHSKGISDKAVKLEYYGFKDGETVPDEKDIEIRYLDGDGDFRSDECIELLKEADIVVSNPPFSLLRDYIALLNKHNKKFLFVGPKAAVIYKEVFPLIKSNKMWFGCHAVKEFIKPCGETQKFGNIGWFTNMPHKSRNDKIILHRKYSPEEYPKYDNYDAVNVGKVVDIPEDYYGYMGVPVTFLDKYNPEQFEICGFTNTGERNEGIRYENSPHGRASVKGKEIYTRIIIKRKQ